MATRAHQELGDFNAVQEDTRSGLLRAGSEFARADTAGTVDPTKAGHSTRE
jgi:hypothetical protein